MPTSASPRSRSTPSSFAPCSARLDLARVRGAHGRHRVGGDDALLEEVHLAVELDPVDPERVPPEAERRAAPSFGKMPWCATLWIVRTARVAASAGVSAASARRYVGTSAVGQSLQWTTSNGRPPAARCRSELGGGAREDREAQRVVRVVLARARRRRPARSKRPGASTTTRSTCEARRPSKTVDFEGPVAEREPQRREPPREEEPLRLERGEPRHHDRHLVAERAERLGKGGDDVGESADLDERGELGRDEEDLHRGARLGRSTMSERASRAEPLRVAPAPPIGQDGRPAPMTRLRAFDETSSRPAGVAEGSVVSVFRVPPEVAGQRLDVFVQSQLHRTSRTRAQSIVRRSAYDASGRRLRPNDRVQAEQRHPAVARAVGRDAGADRHPHPLRGRAPPRRRQAGAPAGAPDGALPQEHAHQGAAGAPARCAFLSLGHRLDRETSGVLLVVEDARVRSRAEEAASPIATTSRRRTSRSPGAYPIGGDGAHERSATSDRSSSTRRARSASRCASATSPEALYASTFIDVESVASRRRRAAPTRACAATSRPAGSTRSASTSRRSARRSSATSSTARTTALRARRRRRAHRRGSRAARAAAPRASRRAPRARAPDHGRAPSPIEAPLPADLAGVLGARLKGREAPCRDRAARARRG